MDQNQTSSLFELHVDQQSSSYLGETAKWAKFLSIVGFVMCGLIVLAALFAGAFFGAAFRQMGMSGGGAVGGAFLSIIYILVALLYFFPCLYLFNFSGKMQVALKNNDQEQLSGSLRNLKSCFKFLGILTIVMLSFYALALLFMMLAVGFR